MDLEPLRFIGEAVEVRFASPPARKKTPPCPDGFVWQGEHFDVEEKLAEWADFSRRGRAALNMQPAHAAVAGRRGSWGVGRFYFRVRVQGGRVFDLYYDRAPKDAGDRLGGWVLYRELA
jgi:hypothetical protein